MGRLLFTSLKINISCLLWCPSCLASCQHVADTTRWISLNQQIMFWRNRKSPLMLFELYLLHNWVGLWMLKLVSLLDSWEKMWTIKANLVLIQYDSIMGVIGLVKTCQHWCLFFIFRRYITQIKQINNISEKNQVQKYSLKRGRWITCFCV